MRYDPARLAFGPDGVAIRSPDQAPEHTLKPLPRGWWERFLHAPPIPSLASDRAAVMLQWFDRDQLPHLAKLSRVWPHSVAGGLVGATLPTPDLVAMPCLLSFHAILADRIIEPPPDQAKPPADRGGRGGRQIDELVGRQARAFQDANDQGPPELLWLAVRSGRQAIADNPDDALAYFRLRNAYAALQKFTREKTWGRTPLVQAIRRAQMTYTLRQFVALNPDLPELAQVHAHLVDLYSRMGFNDLALQHITEQVRLIQEAGPLENEDPGSFDERITGLEGLRDRLADRVKEMMQEYEVGSKTEATSLAKARFALQRGLPNEAIQVLLPEIKELNPEGVQFVLNLLLEIGQLDDLREILDRFKEQKQEELLGVVPLYERYILPTYEWLRLVQAAGTGDYETVEKMFVEIEKKLLDQTCSIIAQFLPGLLMPDPPPLPQATRLPAMLLARIQRLEAHASLIRTTYGPVQQGDLLTLRGMLALEHGETARAAQCFEKALILNPTNDYPSQPAAAYYLAQLRKNQD